MHRPRVSEVDSLPAEGTGSRLLANERHPGMSSTAHFKLLEQTLLATSPERGAVEEDDAENSRSSIILGEQDVLEQQAGTLSHSQSKTRV